MTKWVLTNCTLIILIWILFLVDEYNIIEYIICTEIYFFGVLTSLLLAIITTTIGTSFTLVKSTNDKLKLEASLSLILSMFTIFALINRLLWPFCVG